MDFWENDSVSIGRSRSNDIILETPDISRKHIIVSKLEHPSIYRICDYLSSIGFEISYVNNDEDGLVDFDDLKNKIIELFNLNSLETKDPTYLSNTRSLSILRRCLDAINEVEKGLENDMPIDMIELDIKNIWEELGKINGTSYEEELLDEMFSRFCLGK